MTDEAKKSGSKKWLWIILGVLLLFIIIGAISDEDDGTTGDLATASSTGDVDAAMLSDGDASTAADSDPASEMTGPQRNALRSAKQYISMSGFSRKGLIQQLSSDAGEGYEVADATLAVDSMDIDWNEQAVRSAKQYLDMSGFSCKGLIEQLSSSAGDNYTVSEATYGAEQAGAC